MYYCEAWTCEGGDLIATAFEDGKSGQDWFMSAHSHKGAHFFKFTRVN